MISNFFLCFSITNNTSRSESSHVLNSCLSNSNLLWSKIIALQSHLIQFIFSHKTQPVIYYTQTNSSTGDSLCFLLSLPDIQKLLRRFSHEKFSNERKSFWWAFKLFGSKKFYVRDYLCDVWINFPTRITSVHSRFLCKHYYYDRN